MCDSKVASEWALAFSTVSENTVGTMRSTNKCPIKLKPFSTMTFSCFTRSKVPYVDTVITEHCECPISDKVSVCSRVVSVKGSSCRVPVRKSL